MGSSPKRAYQCERIARQHPDRWWYGIMGDAPRSPVEEAEIAAIDAIEADLDAAGKFPGMYDPAPAKIVEDLPLEQRRDRLEQRYQRARIMRREADARVARRKAKLPEGWHEPMPLKTVIQKLAKEQWIVASRVARRLAQVETTAKALLDALPQRDLATLTYPGCDVATGTMSARPQYAYLHGNKTRFGGRPISLRHKLGKHAKATWIMGIVFVGLILAQTIMSWPIWNTPEVSTLPEGTTTFLQLDAEDIVSGPDIHYFFATNQCMLIARVEGTPYVNFTIGDLEADPVEYIAEEGLNWWAVSFPEEDWGNASSPQELFNLGFNWYNISFTSSMKQYLKAIAIQPVIIGSGECNIPEGEPAFDYFFNATGDLALILYSDSEDFAHLSVQIDDQFLKNGTSDHWNITLGMYAYTEGSSTLTMPFTVESGLHELKLGACDNCSFLITDQYDFDGDQLLTMEEIAHTSDWHTSPFIPEVWGKQTLTQENASGVFDILNGSITDDREIWERRTLDFYVPGAFAGLPTALFMDAYYGSFTSFVIDDDGGMFAGNETISGYYTEDDSVISVVGDDGMVHTGPASEFFSRETLFLGCFEPGWHRIDFRSLMDPLKDPEFGFRINTVDIIITNSESIPAPESDTDGDGICDLDDWSPSYLKWVPNTILQLILPVDTNQDAQIQLQVVRPSHDKSTDVPVEWHEGELGSLKCTVTPALRLFGQGNISDPNYWYKTETFAEFWGENGIDREIKTLNLVDTYKNGTYFTPNNVQPSEFLPDNSTALNYYTFIYPDVSSSVWQFDVRYSATHPAFEDGVLSLFYDFCYVVTAEDPHNGSISILHVYDFNYSSDPSELENLTIAGIRYKGLSDVNAMVASPENYVTTQALWALNQNPAMAAAGEFDWDSEMIDAILTNFTGGRYYESFNYDRNDPSTWSVQERLLHGSMDYSQEGRSLLYDFASYAQGETPSYWGVSDPGSGSYVKVVDSKDGRTKVLEVADLSTSGAVGCWRSFNESILKGRVDFQFYAETFDNTNHHWALGLGSSGTAIAQIRFDNKDLYYGTTSLMTINKKTWYNLSIAFDAYTQKVNISVNAVQKGTTNMPFLARGVPNEFLMNTTPSETNILFSVDDVKFSWTKKIASPKYEGENYVEYTTLTEKTLDVLQKIDYGVKYNQQTDEFYMPYNASWDFYGATPGDNIDDYNWDLLPGYTGGSAIIEHYNSTHMNVGRLQPLSGSSDWIGVYRDFETPQPNGTIDLWFQVIAGQAPTFTIDLKSSSSIGIELLVQDGKLYVCNGSSQFIEVSSIWGGGWFSVQIKYNCTDGMDWYDVELGGATYAYANNLTFMADVSSLDRLSLRAESGGIRYDSIGFSWDETYLSNTFDINDIVGSDTTKRLSFYTVKDVYNGTFKPDSAALKGGDTVLFTTSWDSKFCDLEIATVNLLPTKIQISRSDVSVDGYELHDKLIATYATGLCSPLQLPVVTENAALGITFIDMTVLEVINDLSGDLLYTVPPRLDFCDFLGDMSKTRKSSVQFPLETLTYDEVLNWAVFNVVIDSLFLNGKVVPIFIESDSSQGEGQSKGWKDSLMWLPSSAPFDPPMSYLLLKEMQAQMHSDGWKLMLKHMREVYAQDVIAYTKLKEALLDIIQVKGDIAITKQIRAQLSLQVKDGETYLVHSGKIKPGTGFAADIPETYHVSDVVKWIDELLWNDENLFGTPKIPGLLTITPDEAHSLGITKIDWKYYVDITPEGCDYLRGRNLYDVLGNQIPIYMSDSKDKIIIKLMKASQDSLNSLPWTDASGVKYFREIVDYRDPTLRLLSKWGTIDFDFAGQAALLREWKYGVFKGGTFGTVRTIKKPRAAIFTPVGAPVCNMVNGWGVTTALAFRVEFGGQVRTISVTFDPRISNGNIFIKPDATLLETSIFDLGGLDGREKVIEWAQELLDPKKEIPSPIFTKLRNALDYGKLSMTYTDLSIPAEKAKMILRDPSEHTKNEILLAYRIQDTLNEYPSAKKGWGYRALTYKTDLDFIPDERYAKYISKYWGDECCPAVRGTQHLSYLAYLKNQKTPINTPRSLDSLNPTTDYADRPRRFACTWDLMSKHCKDTEAELVIRMSNNYGFDVKATRLAGTMKKLGYLAEDLRYITCQMEMMCFDIANEMPTEEKLLTYIVTIRNWIELHSGPNYKIDGGFEDPGWSELSGTAYWHGIDNVDASEKWSVLVKRIGDSDALFGANWPAWMRKLPRQKAQLLRDMWAVATKSADRDTIERLMGPCGIARKYSKVRVSVKNFENTLSTVKSYLFYSGKFTSRTYSYFDFSTIYNHEKEFLDLFNFEFFDDVKTRFVKELQDILTFTPNLVSTKDPVDGRLVSQMNYLPLSRITLDGVENFEAKMDDFLGKLGIDQEQIYPHLKRLRAFIVSRQNAEDSWGSTRGRRNGGNIRNPLTSFISTNPEETIEQQFERLCGFLGPDVKSEITGVRVFRNNEWVTIPKSKWATEYFHEGELFIPAGTMKASSGVGTVETHVFMDQPKVDFLSEDAVMKQRLVNKRSVKAVFDADFDKAWNELGVDILAEIETKTLLEEAAQRQAELAAIARATEDMIWGSMSGSERMIRLMHQTTSNGLRISGPAIPKNPPLHPVLSKALGYAMSVGMDFLFDWGNIMIDEGRLQSKGWSNEEALGYGFAHYAPEWCLELVGDIVTDALLAGFYNGITSAIWAFAAPMVVGMIGALVVNLVWQYIWNQYQTLQANWRTDFNIAFDPQIEFSSENNKTLAKHFSLEAGDTLTIATSLENKGTIHYDWEGLWYAQNATEWTVPETGAPFWFQSRYAFAAAGDSPASGDWSDWGGQWNVHDHDLYPETNGWMDNTETGKPLVGTHTYRGGDLNGQVVSYPWNSYTCYKSDPVSFDRTVTLQPMPITQWYIQTQIASTFEDYTDLGTQTQVVTMGDIPVVEANITDFLAASTPVAMNETITAMYDSFAAGLANASYYTSWVLGEDILDRLDEELEYQDEADFQAFAGRTVDLVGDSAPYGYWRATDTRLVPYSDMERSTYVLLTCNDIAEFNSFMVGTPGAGSRYLDEGWRAVNPNWSRLTTTVVADSFDANTEYTPITDWSATGVPQITGTVLDAWPGPNGDKVAHIVDNSATEATKVWRYFGTMTSGTVKWQATYTHGFWQYPTNVTYGLGYGDGSSAPVEKVITFTTVPLLPDDDIGDVVHQGHVVPNYLGVETYYNFKIEWDAVSGNAKLFINDVELFAGDFEFESDHLPNCFMIYTNTTGKTWVNSSLNFNEFEISFDGSLGSGYAAANALAGSMTTPNYQILVPKVWIARQTALYDVRDDVEFSLTREIPLRVDVQAKPEWDGILSFFPGEVADGTLSFTHYGPDDPMVKYSLSVPEGFSISPIDGTALLHSIPRFDFSIEAGADTVAGVYSFILEVTFAENDTVIFARSYPFRYAWNQSVWLEAFGLPETMPWDTAILYAIMGNNGNGPMWAGVEVDGIPTEWLSARGYYEADRLVTFAETFTAWSTPWNLYASNGTQISGESFLSPWQNVTMDAYVNTSNPTANYGSDDYLSVYNHTSAADLLTYLSYGTQSYFIDGGTGTLALQTYASGASRDFMLYEIAGFAEGNGTAALPSDCGVTYSDRPDLLQYFGTYTASQYGGQISEIPISSDTSSFALQALGSDDNVSFWSRERDGTDSGHEYTVQGPKVCFTVPKLYQGDGRVQIQTDSSQWLKLKSNTYHVDFEAGDVLRVTLAANATGEVTIRLMWLNLLIAEFVVIAAGNSFFGKQTVAIPLGSYPSFPHFDEVQLTMTLDGADHEYVQLFDVRVDRSYILPETTSLYGTSFDEDPDDEDVLGNLWTLGGTSAPSMIIDWTLATEDTYVNASDPRQNYADSAILNITGGSSPARAAFLSRPRLPYLQSNASLYLKLNNTGPEGGDVYFYSAGDFVGDWVTWRHAPERQAFCGNASVISGENIFQLNSSAYNFALQASANWTDGTTFASLDDPLSGVLPSFWVNISKVWHGDGIAYMQTNCSETLWLRSPTFTAVTLTAEDWVYLRYATNSSAGAELRLLYQGAVQQTIMLSTSEDDLGVMHWHYENLTAGCLVDQVEVRAALTAGQYVALDDLSFERPTVYNFTNASLYGYYEENVPLAGDIITELGGHRNVTAISNTFNEYNMPYSIGNVSVNGSVEWYLYVPALPLGMNVSAINGSYPNFTLADLASNLTLKLEGPEGNAPLYVCAGWLVAINNTGGAGEGSIASPVTVRQLRTGWSHLNIRLNGDGNFSIAVDGVPIETCVLMNYSIAFNDTWCTLNVTLPGTGGALTYYLDAIGSTGLGDYAVGGNWNMTNVNGTGAFSALSQSHWREYFITVPKNNTTIPGPRVPLFRFVDSVTNTEIGRWQPNTSIEAFYAGSMVNLTVCELHEYAGTEFNYTASITNLGNTYQAFALSTSIPSGWASTDFYEQIDGVWQSAPVVYLEPGEDRNVRASVHPSGYYYCPFNITGEAQGINVTFAALFDNDVEPVFTAGPVASLEWSTEAPHLTWVVTDNYLPAPAWTVYRNGTYFSNGTWTSGTDLDVDIYSLIMQGQASLGVHNFTIYVDDGHVGVAVNSSLVEIYNVAPQELSAPPDAEIEWNTPLELEWTLLDVSLFNGDYQVYVNDQYNCTGVTWFSGVGFILNVTDWYLSAHQSPLHVDIYVYDGLGGCYQDTVGVVVHNTNPSLEAGPGTDRALEWGLEDTLTWVWYDPSVTNQTSCWVEIFEWYNVYQWFYLEPGWVVDQDPNTPGWQATFNIPVNNTEWVMSEQYIWVLQYRPLGIHTIYFHIMDGGGANCNANVNLNITNCIVPGYSWHPKETGEGAVYEYTYGTTGNFNMTWKMQDVSNLDAGWQLWEEDLPWTNGIYNSTQSMTAIEALPHESPINTSGLWTNGSGRAEHVIFDNWGAGFHNKVIKFTGTGTPSNPDMYYRTINDSVCYSMECWVRRESSATVDIYAYDSLYGSICGGVRFNYDGNTYRFKSQGGDVERLYGFDYESSTWVHVRVVWEYQGWPYPYQIFLNGVAAYQGSGYSIDSWPDRIAIKAGTTYAVYIDAIALSNDTGYVTDMSRQAPLPVCGSWVDGSTIEINATDYFQWSQRHDVQLKVWDGLGINTTFAHYVDVTNGDPTIELKRGCVNTIWDSESKTEIHGYNYGDPAPPLLPAFWQVSDPTVSSINGTYKVQYKNVSSWVDVATTFPAVANATGIILNGTTNVYFTPPAGLVIGTYKFRLIVNDKVPGNPKEVAGSEVSEADCNINGPASISQPSDGSYNCYTGTNTFTWTPTDSMMSGATYQIYRKRNGESSWTKLTGSDGYGHYANSTISSGSNIYWTCSDDWVAFAASYTTHSYKVVVNDGYGALSEDAVAVSSYPSNNWFSNWFAQSYNGYSAVGSYYSLQECYSGWFRNQDWWGTTNYAPRALCARPSGNFWMYMGIYSWNGAFTETQLGICMYYDYNNVWFWGLLKDVYGNSFIKLEKIVNGVGYSNQYYVSSTATWWGLEWYGNQVRWRYYDGGTWYNPIGFYSLEYTPGYIGTFYKEWAGWSEPDRYCYFGNMWTGISNGS